MWTHTTYVAHMFVLSVLILCKNHRVPHRNREPDSCKENRLVRMSLCEHEKLHFAFPLKIPFSNSVITTHTHKHTSALSHSIRFALRVQLVRQSTWLLVTYIYTRTSVTNVRSQISCAPLRSHFAQKFNSHVCVYYTTLLWYRECVLSSVSAHTVQSTHSQPNRRQRRTIEKFFRQYNTVNRS